MRLPCLIAVGYKADEIYSPENEGSLFKTNLTDLLAAEEWIRVRTFRDAVSRKRKSNGSTFSLVGVSLKVARLVVPLLIFSILWFLLWYFGMTHLNSIVISILAILLIELRLSGYVRIISKLSVFWIVAHILGVRHVLMLLQIATSRGAMSTDLFRDWLNEKLRQKLKVTNPAFGNKEIVEFGDLLIPLKIVAADGSNQELEVFGTAEHGALSVADAVCASISIPFAFIPKKIGGKEYVDGGIMSNFPAWVFDEELNREGRFTPIIGFRLVGHTEPPPSWEPDVLTHAKNVTACAMFGDGTLETRKLGNLRELLLQVDIGTLEFDADEDKKKAVYHAAYVSAQKALKNSGNTISMERMNQLLLTVEKAIRGSTLITGHLRLCVMLPTDKSTLEVAGTRNMGDDTDDKMSLKRSQGAAGQCWRESRSLVCNLDEARESYAERWKMDKYQQRMVRSSLKSLLCVPILHPECAEKSKAFIGVLCIDSDDDLVDAFTGLVEDSGEGLLDLSCLS